MRIALAERSSGSSAIQQARAAIARLERGEDRGQFELSGETIHFRIDYYDVALEWGSEDPADASITRRVLTLMLREDL